MTFDPKDYYAEARDVSVASCVLSHFDDITDHAAGRRVSAECARGSGSWVGKAFFAKFEDPAVQEARDAAEAARKRAEEEAFQRLMPQPPTILEIDGDPKLCTHTGTLVVINFARHAG